MPMSSPISAGRVRSIYGFISDNRKQYSVQMMVRSVPNLALTYNVPNSDHARILGDPQI